MIGRHYVGPGDWVYLPHINLFTLPYTFNTALDNKIRHKITYLFQ